MREVFLRVFRFSPVSIILPMLHAHLRLHVALTRRTNGLCVETFQKTTLSEIGQHFIRKSAFTLYIILRESSSMVSVLTGVFRSFCLSLRRNTGNRLEVGDRNRNSSISSDDYPCTLHTV